MEYLHLEARSSGSVLNSNHAVWSLEHARANDGPPAALIQPVDTILAYCVAATQYFHFVLKSGDLKHNVVYASSMQNLYFHFCRTQYRHDFDL